MSVGCCSWVWQPMQLKLVKVLGSVWQVRQSIPAWSPDAMGNPPWLGTVTPLMPEEPLLALQPQATGSPSKRSGMRDRLEPVKSTSACAGTPVPRSGDIGAFRDSDARERARPLRA